MATKPVNTPVLKLTLRVPEDLADTYAERASKFGRSTEDEMTRRLSDCREHTATQGFYIDDATRGALTQLAGFTIKSPGDLLAFVKRMTDLDVGGVKIAISPRLADRLKSRQFGVAWEDHITRIVTELLEQFVGMR